MHCTETWCDFHDKFPQQHEMYYNTMSVLKRNKIHIQKLITLQSNSIASNELLENLANHPACTCKMDG